MKLILAIDQGTTSSRAIFFNEEGDPVSVAQRDFSQIFPQPGWVEHDPEEIWATQLSVVVSAMERARIQATDIAAVGIANQRETTVVWERETGRPIANAIVWQDRRTAERIDQLLADGAGPMISQKTGLIPDAYFSASKLEWILNRVDGARAKAEAGKLAFGTIDSWLVYRLTRGAVQVTDIGNAARTMLFNIHTRDWDDELLSLFSIPRGILPEVRSSSEVYGEVPSSLPLGGVPIAGIGGDQHAALFGQLCLGPGMAKNTYGTGCFTLTNTGRHSVASRNRLLTTIAWLVGGEVSYALEGSVFVGGALVQWLRDGLKLIRSAPEVEALARTVDDSGGVYVVPAFTGLGAPHWDPHARGAIFGITRGTTDGHIARASLEAIAFQVADLLDAMRKDCGMELPELRVDGGAAGNDLLMQLQADILQCPVVRPTFTETTALGAAYLAGLAVGYWPSTQALQDNWKTDRRFEPRVSLSRIQESRSLWDRAIERSKNWA